MCRYYSKRSQTVWQPGSAQTRLGSSQRFPDQSRITLRGKGKVKGKVKGGWQGNRVRSRARTGGRKTTPWQQSYQLSIVLT